MAAASATPAAAVAIAVALAADLARAEPPAPVPAPAPAPTPASDLRPVVGFRVRGPSKLTERTLGYLARVAPGERLGAADLPRVQQALVSSELFEKVAVALEPAPGGWLLVGTLDDKHSWIIAPTIFALPGRRSIGVGFAENNFRGENRKILLYGQLGDRESLLFGTYLDPRYRGTQLLWRADVFAYRRLNEEFANLPTDPTDARIARATTVTYLGGGVLAGWQFLWWLSADLRLRAGWVTFRDARTDDDPPSPAPLPERDGWDVTTQARVTLDRRHHRRGVTWGPYLQLGYETSIPGLDDYDYSLAILRAYRSWRFFTSHQLELRVLGSLGRHLPFHEEVSLGGSTDLRGYAVDRYRGDTRLVVRTEYSIGVGSWRSFAFRALAFWDTGVISFERPRPQGDRDYLPTQLSERWWRNDVGAGVRVYFGAIVLPLLGFDLAYGIESRAPGIVFQLGLTDF